MESDAFISVLGVSQIIVAKYSKPFAANRVTGGLPGDDGGEQRFDGLTGNPNGRALDQKPAMQGSSSNGARFPAEWLQREAAPGIEE